MFIVAGCQLQVAGCQFPVQGDRKYLKLKKSSRLGKFNLLVIKTYQFFKTFQVGKIDICRQPDLPV